MTPQTQINTTTAPDNPLLGLGLRPPFYADAANGTVPVDWFEVNTENFMVAGGRPLKVLESVRKHYPIAFHGVSMNLGGTDPLDFEYLRHLKDLINRFEPFIVSDHLCWTRHGGHHLHDLLPLPYDVEVEVHVANRISQVQEYLGRQILVENVSSYAEFDWSELHEWEFLTSITETAGCLILLDINNIIVSAHNHGFDPFEYLQAMSPTKVAQHHLAGHSISGSLKIDTHDHPVPENVWRLFDAAHRRFGSLPTCLERDDDIPPLAELMADLARARNIMDVAVGV